MILYWSTKIYSCLKQICQNFQIPPAILIIEHAIQRLNLANYIMDMVDDKINAKYLWVKKFSPQLNKHYWLRVDRCNLVWKHLPFCKWQESMELQL